MDFPGDTEDENLPANAEDTAYGHRFPVCGPGRFHMPGSDYWARSRGQEQQVLSPHAATTEAHAPRAWASRQEKPLQWEAQALQREKALMWQQRSSAAKH